MPKYPAITKDVHRAKEYFLNKVSFTLGPYELKEMMDHELDNFNLIDVRAYDAYIDGHIPFAVHIPSDRLEEFLPKLPKDKINIVYCYREECHLAAKCAVKMCEHHMATMELTGGFDAWKDYGYEIIRESATDNK